MTVRRARDPDAPTTVPVSREERSSPESAPVLASSGAVQMRPEKLALSPIYRHLRDSITRPHLRLTESRYFWERWKPRLGPDATILVMEVRDRCNRSLAAVEGTDGSGGDCTVGALELAAACGFSRVTLWRILQREEVKRFVWVEHNYVYDPSMGKKRRTISTYHVLMEDPLIEEDEAYVQSLIGANPSPTVQSVMLVETIAAPATFASPQPQLQHETEIVTPSVQPVTASVPFIMKPVNVPTTNQRERFSETERGGIASVGHVVKQGDLTDPRAFVAGLLGRESSASPHALGPLREPVEDTTSRRSEPTLIKSTAQRPFVSPNLARPRTAPRPIAEKYPELAPFVDHAERLLGDRHSRGFYVTALRHLHPAHMDVWHRALGLAAEQPPETIRRSRGALFNSLLRSFAAAAGVSFSASRARDG